MKLTTWNSHGAHGHCPCHPRPSQWSTRAQHGWILRRWPAGWQECLAGERGLYSQIQLSPFSSQPTGPFWKNPPWDPLSKAAPFPSLCLVQGLHHDLKLSFSYSGWLVYWVPYPKLLHDNENLGPFFLHHVLRCVTQCLMRTGTPHSLVVLVKNSGRSWRYCGFSSRPDHHNKANTVIKGITWVSQCIWKLCLHYTVAY